MQAHLWSMVKEVSWLGLALIFIDDVTHDGKSRLNSEVNKNILNANLWRNVSKLIGRNFIMQQDNDPKHCQHNKGLHYGEKVEGFSRDLNPIEHAFHMRRLKRKSPRNKLKEAAIKTWKNIRKERMEQFGDVNGSQAWCVRIPVCLGHVFSLFSVCPTRVNVLGSYPWLVIYLGLLNFTIVGTKSR